MEELISATNSDNRLYPRPDSTPLKSKSSHRMVYESEVVVIKRQLGDLEQIRQNLGLSQRKICQLLMVDPSAWTRWIKTDGAPPHIYRALQWYLQLVDKHPSLKPALFLADFRSKAPALTAPNLDLGKMKDSLSLVAREIKRLKQVYVFALITCLTLAAVFALSR